MYCVCVLCTYTFLVSDPAPNLYMYARILTQKHVIVKLNAKLRHNKWCVQKEFLTKIDGIYIYASKITHTHKRIQTHKTKIDEENNQRSNKKCIRSHNWSRFHSIPFDLLSQDIRYYCSFCQIKLCFIILLLCHAWKLIKTTIRPMIPPPKIKWHIRYTLKHISLHWASFNSGKPYPYICLSTHLHLHTRSRVPHISRWWISKCNNRGGGKSTGRFKRKGQDGIAWAPENRRHYTCTGAN